jgi:4-carboxymuconolactone decarboxylase
MGILADRESRLLIGGKLLGFPLGSRFDGVVSSVIKKRKKAAEKGGGRDTAEERRANVNAAVRMHSGGSVHDE